MSLSFADCDVSDVSKSEYLFFHEKSRFPNVGISKMASFPLSQETEDHGNKLTDYLLHHEEDIACGVNDFDDLRECFELIIGREPISDEDYL